MLPGLGDGQLDYESKQHRLSSISSLASPIHIREAAISTKINAPRNRKK
jgi:hypothetical protein